MEKPSGSMFRRVADDDLVEEHERDWADLGKIDEVIRWLDRRTTGRRVPAWIVSTLLGHQEVTAAFLRSVSWDVVDASIEADRAHSDSLPLEGVEDTAGFWTSLDALEAAIAWLEAECSGDPCDVPGGIDAMFYTFITYWLDVVDAASTQLKEAHVG